MQITTVGLDIAKRAFQLHGVDAAGKAVLRRKLSARVSTGSRHWFRRGWRRTRSADTCLCFADGGAIC